MILIRREVDVTPRAVTTIIIIRGHTRYSSESQTTMKFYRFASHVFELYVLCIALHARITVARSKSYCSSAPPRAFVLHTRLPVCQFTRAAAICTISVHCSSSRRSRCAAVVVMQLNYARVIAAYG